jgi:MoaA/NifB/PqqE/SkfB family radical SAM enzyme
MNKRERTLIVDTKKLYVNEEYSIYFDMKSGYEILTGVNGNPDPFSLVLPSLLDIGIKGTCPNKCEFCYQGDKNEPDMTLKNFKIIIDQVKDHTMQVALGGRGDPDTHKDFKEILMYCRENNVIPNYTTSGQRLTPVELNLSKQYCGAVAVSYYPTLKKNYYDITTTMIDMNIKTNLHIIFYKPYEKNIFEFLSTGKSGLKLPEGLNLILFLLYKPAGRAYLKPELVPSNESIEKFLELVLTYMKDIYPQTHIKLGVDSCLACRMNQFKSFKKLDQTSIDICEGARMAAYISPTMKFMPCSFADEDKYGVSLENETIRDVWTNNPIFLKFRKDLAEQPVCPLRY